MSDATLKWLNLCQKKTELTKQLKLQGAQAVQCSKVENLSLQGIET